LWVQGKALSEYEAEPHSAQADQAVQSKAKKHIEVVLYYKCISKKQNLHRFSILLHKVKSAKSEAILRR